MNDLRLVRAAALAVLVAACSAPSQTRQSNDAEIAAMMPLKRQYSDVVMGFDVHPQTTLIVSVDLQQYIETDDETIAAIRRSALARWRAAWVAAHPRQHAVLQVRFIDFIGRKVATESTKV
ncbi:MAG TPA: hypothetical protein VKR05_06360 [Candidatus Cybelea sp.]|nr:hypothetical protein [Candidatus Cybelea sp.]